MSKLPVISGKEILKLLQRKGFKVVGRKGSHTRLKKRIDSKQSLITIIPMHKELAPGTLSSILRQTKLSKEELFED